MATIVIGSRYNGIPDVALGGYVGGILARGRKKAEVSLRRPVRLEKQYQANAGPDNSELLLEGNDVYAIARECSLDDLNLPHSVEFEEAKIASGQYPGHGRHLFPTCFVCGTSRAEGDGLRIFPGKVAGRDVVAAPWRPSKDLGNSGGIVKPEFIWSALDCPTIWALILTGMPDSKDQAVTSKLAVQLINPAQVDQDNVVVGWKIGETDRTRVAGGAIYSDNGQLLAVARHTLVTTSWGVPMGLNNWL